MSIGHKIAIGAVRLTSHLPMGVLYAISQLLYLLIYRVVGYRRKLTRRNLTDSFPDLSLKEIKVIEREFYHNFAYSIVETVKLASISQKEINRRMKFENVALIEKYLSQGRPIVAYFSHCGNWEWVTSLPTALDMPNIEFSQVYRPLKNKCMDSLMLMIRQRFGARSYPKATVMRELLRRRREGIATITGFMSDQKPSHGDDGYITTFLNHPTAMISGTETLARKFNAAVVYIDMTRIARGYYHARFIDMAEQAADTQPGQLSQLYTDLLEANIRRQPSLWLWTHNRWKHRVTIPVAQE